MNLGFEDPRYVAELSARSRPRSSSFLRLVKYSFMFLSVASDRTNVRQATGINLAIARSRSQLEDAFRLVYRSYIRAGLQAPNPQEMRLLRHHFLTSTEVMVATKDGETISTASLIVDSPLGLPAESMYRAEIDTIRLAGIKLAEVGCLADRRESPARFIAMFRKLSTLITQAAAERGCHGLIAATHPRHARFYMRQLGFRRMGDIRECPYVKGNPAVLLYLNFDAIRGTDLHEHFFGKKYPAAALSPYEWDNETRVYFQSILDQIETQPASPVNCGNQTPESHD